MILVLGLLVLVAAVVVLLGGSAGAALFGGRTRPERSGLGIPFAVGGGAGIVVLILVAALVGIGGLRSGRSNSDQGESAVTSSVPQRIVKDPDAPVAGPLSTFDGVVRLEAERSTLRPSPSIGNLENGDVLDVRATGFVAGVEGVIAQCPDLRGSRCENVYPVRADDGGRVRVPYRLVEGLGAGTLVIEVDGERAGAALVFGGATPALARLGVDRGFVRIIGGSPDAAVRIARCRSDVVALRQCAIGPSFRLGHDGSRRIEVAAGRDSQRIVIVGEGGSAITDPIVLRGRPGPEVGHDPTRLVLGFGLALALLGIAVALIRSTDWRVSAEAATPFLDAATLDG